MTEAATKCCGTCRWFKLPRIGNPWGRCEYPMPEWTKLAQGNSGLYPTEGRACPAHSSADDAKRREEFSSFVTAVRELAKRDRYAVRGLEAQGIYPTEWSNVLNPVEAMIKEMEEA